MVEALAPYLRDVVSEVSDSALRDTIRRFYRFVAEEDLREIPPTRVADQVRDFLELARVRTTGEAIVRILPASKESGAVVCIVTDDMPFLVDSVTNELVREGRSIHRVVHPQFAVKRDASGTLLEVLDLDVDEPAPSGTLAESWMRIELQPDLIPPPEEVTEENVRRVLADVRVAVEDWPSMSAQALEIAAELSAAPPAGIAPIDVVEGADLLRWLTDEHFTFLGYREYALVSWAGQDVLEPVAGSGLGILRIDPQSESSSASASFAAMPPAVRAKAREPHLLVLTKANSRATVHRPGYLDYVGVKSFDANGKVIGERRFLGLFTASAYSESVSQVPVLRRRVSEIMESLELVPGSHSAKDLQAFLETYPRDEFFQAHTWQLLAIAGSVLHLQERRQTKAYLRSDDYGRFVSVLVYLPRDRYNSTTRKRIETILMREFGGVSVDYTALITESVLARLHYVIHVDPTIGIPEIDHAALEAELAQAARSWEDTFVDDLIAILGDDEAARFARMYASAFTESYKEDFTSETAVSDVRILEELEPGQMHVDFYGSDEPRFKVLRIGSAMSLSRLLPILQRMGVEVLDEYPYEIRRADGQEAWVLDFGLALPAGDIAVAESLAERFEDGFRAAWSGECEVDDFNALIVRAGLTWKQSALIRAYSRYMRQIGTTFGQDYIEQVVAANSAITVLLVTLFETQFAEGVPERSVNADALVFEIESRLDAVVSLDHDRILRTMLGLVRATLRTSYFLPARERRALAFKLDPSAITDLPLPRPRFEIWVYSPRVEGVHLRFGMVARGGLRWSDRREDFRTEILGLVKAQEVKNAVIVPVGAKGGFLPKQLPDPTVDREAWMTEGKAAYREFVSALLDLTDNLVKGTLVPPVDVVRRDGDDPYLVVAADKGTATFSDLANSISKEYHFWLGDAFASGGSVGYDHKAMGITARGAWESVKRHFRELDLDTQTQDFTVVGIGDMSGDVFGNGMLLSERIRLVAAFDHRDIFIDPTPDAGRSFAERSRLFALARSSWADYDPSLISAGGGVFSRAAKSVTITPEMRACLGIDPEISHLTPAELIHSILLAPVDLLWNGGIGTYVKAATETNAAAGDKANDAIRVDGGRLRCRIVGEGGNLGFTQLGRVEAARAGIRINTDAIDNSAGVDTSDHEVNVKILLDGLIARGLLEAGKRDALLASMTDEVAAQVLADNYAQNVVLGNARAGAVGLLTVHQRLIADFEARGMLDRAIEFLPDDAEFAARRAAGQGLTSPELAVLLAYVKNELTAEVTASSLPLESWTSKALTEYFPSRLREEFGQQFDAHPLRNEIISTVICNELVNLAGITFVFRAMEETGANPIEVVRAAAVVIEIFGIRQMWQAINAEDNAIPTAAQTAMHLEVRRLLDRATRWFLQTRGGTLDVEAEIARLRPIIEQYAPEVAGALVGGEARRLQMQTAAFVGLGAEPGLAARAAEALDVFALLDIAEVARRIDESMATLLPLYFTVSETYGVDSTLGRITALPRTDRWNALARQALRSDLYAAVAALTNRVARSTPATVTPVERVAAWESVHADGLGRARATLAEISSQEDADLATLSVSLRVMRNLVAQGSASQGSGQ
ncbi:MAG: NAD-glutamate dehydrogenase [Candidatus Nanopelagicales bacterium]